MRILLVYPNIVESPKDISEGLGIISAILKREGHETLLLDSTFGLKKEEVIRKTKKFDPDLLFVTTATNDFENTKKICRLVRKIKPILTVAGGFHPTIAPEETIQQDCFDIVCVGEGEGAVLDLIKSLEKGKLNTKIKNLWLKKNNKIIKNPIRNLEEDLDFLPFPDREIYDYEKYLKWNHGTATFITTRGCPFNCTYCINHFLANMYKGKGKYVRFRSVDNILEEIKQVLKKYGEKIKNLEFYDDTFTLDKKRIKEFCERYPKEIGLPFNVNARVNATSKEIFQMLKKAGCVRVSIGVESGDPIIRNKILRRNMTAKQVVETFKWAKQMGLKTYSFNMVGIPFETKESIQKTIKLNRIIKPDYIGVSIFNAFKGTESYDLVKKHGWLKDTYATSYFRESNIKHPNFTSRQLIRIRTTFGFKVFITYKPIRAFIDLTDRFLSRFDSYTFLRAKIIKLLGVLKH